MSKSKAELFQDRQLIEAIFGFALKLVGVHVHYSFSILQFVEIGNNLEILKSLNIEHLIVK